MVRAQPLGIAPDGSANKLQSEVFTRLGSMSSDGQPIPVFHPDQRHHLWWLKPAARVRVSKIFPVFTEFITVRNDIIDGISNSMNLQDVLKAVDVLQLGVNSLWFQRYPNEPRIKFVSSESIASRREWLC